MTLFFGVGLRAVGLACVGFFDAGLRGAGRPDDFLRVEGFLVRVEVVAFLRGEGLLGDGLRGLAINCSPPYKKGREPCAMQ